MYALFSHVYMMFMIVKSSNYTLYCEARIHCTIPHTYTEPRIP